MLVYLSLIFLFLNIVIRGLLQKEGLISRETNFLLQLKLHEKLLLLLCTIESLIVIGWLTGIKQGIIFCLIVFCCLCLLLEWERHSRAEHLTLNDVLVCCGIHIDNLELIFAGKTRPILTCLPYLRFFLLCKRSEFDIMNEGQPCYGILNLNACIIIS